VIDNSPPVEVDYYLSLGRYLYWWTIIYHWVDTSTGGLLSITASIPLLVDYYLSLGRYLYWWTIIYHWVDTSTGIDPVIDNSPPAEV
jgi:hypothetical protein